MLIKVKVHPESKKNEVVKKSPDSYEVYVRARAELGMANRETILMLSSYFEVPEGKIRLIKGGKKPNKIFDILEPSLFG